MEVRATAAQTRNHWWWRPDWEVGARHYRWALTFEHCHELHLLAATTRPALRAHPAQDAVPDAWLHLTTTPIGFSDDVTPEQAAEVADRTLAQIDEVPDGVLTLDGFDVTGEGVVLTARKDLWLGELAALQRRVIEELLGPREWDRQWSPHIALAYANGTEPASGLVDSLRGCAPRQPELVVSRPRISLVRMNRDARQYQWDVVAQRSLGPF